MISIKTTALAGLLALSAFSTAHAGVISGTFTINIYQGSGGNDGNNPNNQAVNTNPLLQTTAIATVTYTGPINFNEASDGSNKISDFLTSGGGSYTITSLGSSGVDKLSTSGYGLTTVFDIFSTGNNFGSMGDTGTISHDDGATLYQGGVVVSSSPAPTVDIPTSYTLASNTPIELVYVEANGLPADLTMVPEPASMALLGVGMIGMGVVSRRRRSTAPTC